MSESSGPLAGVNLSRQLAGKSGDGSAGAEKPGNLKWYLLLLLPYIGLLWVPWYAKSEPQLWGIPFFYWYQFLWVFITMLLTEFVYRRTR
jgi:hypothetical protein